VANKVGNISEQASNGGARELKAKAGSRDSGARDGHRWIFPLILLPHAEYAQRGWEREGKSKMLLVLRPHKYPESG
jgi:hypothetical protein